MPYEQAHASDQFSAPYRFPYQIGLFLAANAIPDVYALIDGPDCVIRKAEWVFGKHDWSSTLMDVCGAHRVVATLVNSEGVIKTKGEEVVQRISTISERPDAGAVLVCSMPHVTIIGTQYDKILREMQPRVRARLVEVPSRSLDGDWIDGYAETLTALASHVDVSGARPDRNKVAIVGHLMDRTEQDHRANVAELRRVLGALDLEVSSVWLEGEPFDRLSAAKDAGTIIALPLGRKAARTLAARTGADVLDVDVPFGLARTRRLLRDVGRALRRERAAEAFVDQELRRLLPRVEWVLRHVFFGKKAIFSGSPDLFGAMRQVLSELGMEVRHMSSPSSRTHLPADFERDGGSLPPMLFAPTLETLRKELAPVIGEGIDLAIGNSLFCDMVGAEAPVVEVGFPAHFSHALSARPLLGFEGWIHFVDRASEALQRGARATRFARRQNLFERGRIEELLGVAKRLREGESPMAVAAAIEAIARGGAAPSRGGAGEPRPERSGPLDEPSRADDLERGGLDELAAE